MTRMTAGQMVAADDVIVRSQGPGSGRVPGSNVRTRFRSAAGAEPCGEQGSGTILMLGVVGATLTVFMATVLVASAVLAMHRARSAADLSALGAASTLLAGVVGVGVGAGVGNDPGQACAAAATVAKANNATLESCAVAGQEVTVVAVVALPARLEQLNLGPARATAKAGPSPNGAQPGLAAPAEAARESG